MPRPATGTPPKRRNSAPVAEVIGHLRSAYPDATCSLAHERPFELLVATILSAQCTDARVNQVTPPLFRKFPDARAMAKASHPALEEAIRSTGFFRAKAKSLLGASRRIVEEFGGEVPRTMEELVTLPGVGRKTANVVLGNVWDAPGGVVVDTHVGRIARRLGWTRHDDPEKVETDLNGLVPKSLWVWISHALILHGRAVCTSRAPKCGACLLSQACPREGVEAAPKGPKANKTTKTRGGKMS
jgi:endonuclease-3